jgi:type II secretory pathway predicted ATPase ExeA
VNLLALYGLKWNPFSADVPIEALWRFPGLEHFCWRIENQVREGGFALITGDPGTGKSVSLRILAGHLADLRDVEVGVLTRPQSAIADFYRELGQLFGIALRPHNRWAGFKALRQKWLTHVETTRYRPVLLLDEAQEIPAPVLAELRILASTDFDSRSILTVVLSGDPRLTQQFRRDELIPIASRIRARLNLDYLTPKELLLTEHAAGNLRVLATMAYEMLALAASREISQLDQKLYFEAFTPTSRPKPTAQAPSARA